MYNIKVYSVAPFSSMALTPWTWSVTFKKTLSNKEISTWIKFSNEINVGYWPFAFRYHWWLDDVENGDIVKVYKWSTLVYFGKVYNKVVSLQAWWIIQDIQCRAYNAVLNDFYYDSWWSYSFTKTDDPKNIITDIVWQSDVEVTYFSTDYTNMSLVWSNVSIAFDDDTLQSALQKVLWTTTYYYALRPDGKIYFAALPVTSSHNFTFGNDIREIQIEYNSDELVNYVVLDYDWWSTTGSDTTSRYENGSKYKRITDTNIKNLTTATAYINKLLQEKAELRDTIRIDINNSYDTTTLYPGQMINVSNCPIEIKEKIIRRVEYSDKWTSLYLNTKETIEKALSKLIS